jgi:NAD+ kinase
MHLLLTGNPQKAKLWTPLRAAVAWLRARSVPFLVDSRLESGLHALGEANLPLTTLPWPEDALVLSFGGDGTLLNRAREADGLPVLGVNVGRLGFLADIEVEMLEHALQHVIAGSYRVEERTQLEISSTAFPNAPVRFALNELVIERGGMPGLLRIHVTINGEVLNAYWGDGLIVATPTGSTAYSLSAGGPIVVPTTPALVLCALAPHSLTVRPVVVPDTVTLHLSVAEAGAECVVAVDGVRTPLKDTHATFTLRKAPQPVRLIKLPGQAYFDTLRKKLMWGADGTYQ